MKWLFSLLLIGFGFAAHAQANQLIDQNNPLYSECGCDIKLIKADFTVKATAGEKTGPYKDWGYDGTRFKVHDIWKGPDNMPQEIVVDGLNKNGKCSIFFEQGKTYLISGVIITFGDGAKLQRWFTSPCHGTKLFDDTDEGIKALGKPIKTFSEK